MHRLRIALVEIRAALGKTSFPRFTHARRAQPNGESGCP